jgi:hypothetical protein
MQPDMIEEKINIEGLATHFERHLAADKGKSAAQFQKKVSEMIKQSTLDLPLEHLLRDS